MNLPEKIAQQIKSQFENDSSGHDWFHIERVWKMSKFLQEKEGGDLEVIELAALLHDISDYKLNGGKLDIGGQVARSILTEHNCDEETIEKVAYIVDNISYKGANTQAEMKSIEGKIVQDADRLDAIGAIGIARTFAYGGHKGQPMYDPTLNPTLHESFEAYANSRTSTINHFYEKLLLLKNRLNTTTAKEIGEKRHKIMEDFLKDFYDEWNTNLR